MLYYAKSEAPILCLPDTKNQLIGKDPGAGKDWRQKDTGQQRMRWLNSITDSMKVNIRKLQQASGGQGSLAHCSPWGCKESDMTEWLNCQNYFEERMSIKYRVLWFKQFWHLLLKDQNKQKMKTQQYVLWIRNLINARISIYTKIFI